MNIFDKKKLLSKLKCSNNRLIVLTGEEIHTYEYSKIIKNLIDKKYKNTNNVCYNLFDKYELIEIVENDINNKKKMSNINIKNYINNVKKNNITLICTNKLYNFYIYKNVDHLVINCFDHNSTLNEFIIDNKFYINGFYINIFKLKFIKTINNKYIFFNALFFCYLKTTKKKIININDLLIIENYKIIYNIKDLFKNIYYENINKILFIISQIQISTSDYTLFLKEFSKEIITIQKGKYNIKNTLNQLTLLDILLKTNELEEFWLQITQIMIEITLKNKNFKINI